MAKGIIKKKFKCFELSPMECAALGFGCSDGLICCECNNLTEFNETDKKLYYVAVLNEVMCEKCFEEFIRESKWFSEDAYYEDKNYEYIFQKLAMLNR